MVEWTTTGDGNPFFQLPAALDKSVIFGLINKPWFPLKTFENIFFLILFYSNNITDSIKQYALCKRNPKPLSFRDHDFVSTVFLKKSIIKLKQIEFCDGSNLKCGLP